MSEHGDFPLEGLRHEPQVHPSAFVAPNATLVGEVTLAELCSVLFGAVLRADTAAIRVGARSNLQDGVVVHCDQGKPVLLEEEVSVGHGAILHGCVLRRGCLIGIGARVLNLAEVGPDCLVAAGALVPERARIPERSLVVGVPGRVLPLPAKFHEMMDQTWRHYVSYREQYLARGIGRWPRG